MSDDLRALLVEDSPDDAELLIRELRRGGYSPEWLRVQTRDEFRAALQRQVWDLVLSDYSLPSFSAPEAFAVLKETGLDLPFIIVSGTVGEETAVAAMREGVHDYLLKGKLTRLAAAVERELREAALRAERRKMQERLLMADRMASVGTLAAGVAHEVNNPLAVILANLEFAVNDLQQLVDDARSQIPGDAWRDWLARRIAELAKPLRDAQECSERVRHIVQDLKVFSRSGNEERAGPVDVRRVLETSLRMAGNEIRHRARLLEDYAEVPAVQASESRLGQVFLNLIVNAAHAIPQGRAENHEIRIRTGMADLKRVVVEVHDTGTGIAPEHMSRIFDAFFTTKPAGVGMGLGLAICHRIITDLGGEIAVRSELGKGSSFRVLLPIARHVDQETPTSAPLVVHSPRRGRILIVDDEPMVQSSVLRMLGRDHEVIAEARAQEALQRLLAGEEFDVILCDLMMPHMTGMDLHAELARALPRAADRIVFMTAGAFTPTAREFLGEVANPRLEKPFDARSLRSLVQSLLRE
jgi:signal transduction histidine kinase